MTLEAFLARKPVVTATDSGGTLTFVEDGVSGLVCEPRAEAVGAAFDALADRGRAAALGGAGHARAAARRHLGRRAREARAGMRTTAPGERFVRLAVFTPLAPARSGMAHYAAELLPALSRRHAIDVFAEPPAGRGRRAGRHRRVRRARLRLEARTAEPLRPDGLPARERPVSRLHVGLPDALPRPGRPARPPTAPVAGAGASGKRTRRTATGRSWRSTTRTPRPTWWSSASRACSATTWSTCGRCCGSPSRPRGWSPCTASGSPTGCAATIRTPRSSPFALGVDDPLSRRRAAGGGAGARPGSGSDWRPTRSCSPPWAAWPPRSGCRRSCARWPPSRTPIPSGAPRPRRRRGRAATTSCGTRRRAASPTAWSARDTSRTPRSETVSRQRTSASACAGRAAGRISASWLRCLAAGKPTIVTDLPHLGGIPVLVTRRVWTPSHLAADSAGAADRGLHRSARRGTLARHRDAAPGRGRRPAPPPRRAGAGLVARAPPDRPRGGRLRAGAGARRRPSGAGPAGGAPAGRRRPDARPAGALRPLSGRRVRPDRRTRPAGAAPRLDRRANRRYPDRR